MKLQLLSFLVLTSVVLSSSVCIRNVIKRMNNMPIWMCMRTKDLAADIARAPKDVKAVGVIFSDIPKLKDGTLTPLANTLEVLMIINSNMEDMDDNALMGLKELKVLDLSGNKLTTLKSVWFRDMMNLKTLKVRDNMIHTIDEEIATLLKNLEELDISLNDIEECLSIDALNKQTKLRTFNWLMNPGHMRCFREMMMWMKEKGLMIDGKKVEHLDHSILVFTKTCMDEMTKDGKKVDDVEIDKCVNDRMDKMMEERKVDTTMWP